SDLVRTPLNPPSGDFRRVLPNPSRSPDPHPLPPLPLSDIRLWITQQPTNGSYEPTNGTFILSTDTIGCSINQSLGNLSVKHRLALDRQAAGPAPGRRPVHLPGRLPDQRVPGGQAARHQDRHQ